MLSLKERFIRLFYHTECPSEKAREIGRPTNFRKCSYTSSSNLFKLSEEQEAQSLAQAKLDVDSMDLQASLTEERMRQHIRRKSLHRPGVSTPASEEYRPWGKELGYAGSTVSSID
ncbi:MAG: hypothetical protein M1835_004922 [Candelina submexicana]|nr:MAG: hypothetical protein M1835_004922 [Candelina submexicana]